MKTKPKKTKIEPVCLRIYTCYKGIKEICVFLLESIHQVKYLKLYKSYTKKK